ncbi:MAG: ferrous iron transport protein B [Bacteroidetes bacterium]|nr:ferrous iron transport protein B [Bacteroidota bacterium]
MTSNEIPTHTLRTIALIGNPNCGKTTLFNTLTGLRHKVGNYPGVTVEKKEGTIRVGASDVTLLDLPGTYSLSANSPDEQIVSDVLFGRIAGTPVPDLIIFVADATNLERNLYLLSQIVDLSVPVVVALNMIDLVAASGLEIDTAMLEQEFGVAFIPMIANNGTGVDRLLSSLSAAVPQAAGLRRWPLPEPVQREHKELVSLLVSNERLTEPAAFHEAQLLLSASEVPTLPWRELTEETRSHLRQDHENLDRIGIKRHSVFVESRYRWIRSVYKKSVIHTAERKRQTLSDSIDAVLTHRVWGFVVFFALMAVMFQTIFTWANYPMELIGSGFEMLAGLASQIIPPGDLQSLVANGIIGGVGAVVTFLPQILFLFLFLGLLEDTGYMARAAFIMDRLMSTVGLHGKSFIPLLSSFACAIPGIMATRTIENPRDRLVTILVAPLMSCSARLPVFALLIASFVPDITVFGFLSLPAIVLISMYLLGLGSALLTARLLKSTLLKGPTPPFIMELPTYRMPSLRNTIIHMWERSVLFLKNAGTIILGVSIILWFLATYPKMESGSPSERLAHSYVGQAGQFIEPVLRPLGFDWKIGIGIISSVLQREVFVGTLGTIYNIENADEENSTLREQMLRDVNPATGAPTFTLLTAICIMVYYVLAMQCLSTVAVVRRETNGWKWPAFQFIYMTLLAYAGTFLTYRIGTWIIS